MVNDIHEISVSFKMNKLNMYELINFEKKLNSADDLKKILKILNEQKIYESSISGIIEALDYYKNFKKYASLYRALVYIGKCTNDQLLLNIDETVFNRMMQS
jgi:hypothetical protein